MPPPEPEPEPVAPDPVMVTFTPPDPNDETLDLMCDRNPGSPMCPDGSRNMATAMATVNPDMAVTSNTTAVIVPMNFAEGANPVKVHEGENMPFTYVSWEALQSTVVGDGATFKIMRVTLGANQEEMPTGDVAYVTCGPFECVDGMDAPEISIENSAICTTFEVDLQFVVGVIDGLGGTDRDADDTTVDPYSMGVDLGLVYTANAGFAVTHDFGDFSEKGFSGSKTSISKALKAGISNPTTPSPTDNMSILDAADTVVVDIAGCEPVDHDLYTQPGASALDRPENCARMTSTDDDPYFADYSVTLTPSAGLGWSRNAWPQIPKSAAQKCAGTTFAVSDQVDVCEMLEDEVALMDEGTASAIPVVSIGGDSPAGQGATRTNQARLMGFDLSLPIDQTRWTSLSYYDTTTANKRDMDDVYDDEREAVDDAPLPAAVDTSTNAANYTANAMGRLNGMNGANVWVSILDKKGAPMYGDLGKVDAAALAQTSVAENTTEDALLEGNSAYTGPFGADNVPDNFTIETYAGSTAARACSKVDGGEDGSGKTRRYLKDGVDAGPGAVAAEDTGIAGASGTYDIRSLRTGGSLCDAEDVEIDTSVTFTDNMGFGCSIERSFTLTCDWDASGGLTLHQAQTNELVGATLPNDAGNIGEANADDFVSCAVEMN
jgi:hypothetical protein